MSFETRAGRRAEATRARRRDGWRRGWIALFALQLSLSHVACSNTESGLSDVDPDTDTDTSTDTSTDSDFASEIEPADLQLESVLVAENPANVLSYFVEWRTEPAATTSLTVDCGPEYQGNFESDERTTRHEVFVMGLIDGLRCELLLESVDGDAGGTAMATIEQVGPLPSDLPSLTLVSADPTRVQAGWTLTSLTTVSTLTAQLLVLVDAEGRYRWYRHHTATRWRGHVSDLSPFLGGLLVGGEGSAPMATHLEWDGTVVWEGDFSMHHDIRPSPFHEDSLLFLSKSGEGCPEGIEDHTANEVDAATGEILWTWRICDHYTHSIGQVGGAHANAIVAVPGAQSVLLSLRNESNIIRVNRETDEIEWILGERGDFEMADEDRFLRQHAPEVQPNGNILLFDNGGAARPYSRALELALTFDENGDPERAEAVWDYTDTSLYAPHRSEADRLANGNTLITYELRDGERRTVLLREVTRDGSVVWELESQPDYATYRSERIEIPPLGFVRGPR